MRETSRPVRVAYSWMNSSRVYQPGSPGRDRRRCRKSSSRARARRRLRGRRSWSSPNRGPLPHGRCRRSQHQVIELEIVVDQRGSERPGTCPASQVITPSISGLSSVLARRQRSAPSLDLPLQEAFGLAQRQQIILDQIDRVQGTKQSMKPRLTRAASPARGERRTGPRPRSTDAVPTLHQKKWGADDRRVFAQQVHFGRGRERRVDSLPSTRYSRAIREPWALPVRGADGGAHTRRPPARTR